jgi:hypothetical protein
MAKNNPKRVPSQSVISGPIPIIGSNDPDRMFIKPNAALVRNTDGVINYSSFLSAPQEQYSYTVPIDTQILNSTKLKVVPVVTGSVDLSEIESVVGESYLDSLNNPRIKYTLKIKNPDKVNITGVDARIYNPYA